MVRPAVRQAPSTGVRFMAPVTNIRRYRLLERIGAGGMGEVYLAHDPQLDRRVAIKLLPADLATDPVARERLRREAFAAAALDHPFIRKIFEVGQDAGTIFIAMEYVRGDTLLTRIRAGRLPLAETLRIAGEIMEAIEEAHSANLIHRDLKPANIMLTSQGRVKIMDFGLARKADACAGSQTLTVHEPLTGKGSAVGTPGYMSPEQLTGAPLDGRSDLFSCGIILCELLTGAHPFQGHSATETIASILRDPPRLETAGSAELSHDVQHVDPGLMVFIRRLLAKSPNERYLSVREARSDLARLTLPSTAAERHVDSSVCLIGRDAERDQLLRLLRAALAGQGSLALIGGEPGIGKTHFTRAILAEAQKLGCFGVTGHCYEMEGAPPYVPFIEALEYCARIAPPETFRYSIGESAPEIARLMPELRRLYPDIPPAIELPPEQQRRFLFNAYREFVDRSARLTPIVAVFEDLHWADEATLLLLGHLAQTVSTIPVLLIGTYRNVDLDVTRPFARALETWVRDKVATRLSLRRLGLPGVRAMLAALSGKTPPEWLADVVHGETEGNPFFVEEVFRHLLEEGKLFDETGGWSTELRGGEIEVPQSVRLVIGRRLQRLEERTRRVLATAAIVGRSFDLGVLEALEKEEPDSVLDALEEAERAQIVEPDPGGRQVRYWFVHELLRQTLVDSVSLPRRQRLHGRIADAIESTHKAAAASYASAIAHHLYHAGAAADTNRTIEYLMIATRQASAAAAHEEALANAGKALSLIESGRHPLGPELQLARAAALRSMARWTEAIDAYRTAFTRSVESANAAKAAEATVQLAYIYLWRSEGMRAAALVNEALKLTGTLPAVSVYRLRLLNAVTLTVIGDVEASRAALREAKQMEPALPEIAGDGFPGLCEARVRFSFAQISQAEQCAHDAIRRFGAAGDLWGEADLFEPAIAALWLGRIDEFEALLIGSLRLAERVGHRSALWAFTSLDAQRMVARGDLEKAEARLREAHNLAESFANGWGFVDFIVFGAIAYYRGELDKAERLVRKGLAIEPVTYQAGQLIALLFVILAAKFDPNAAAALESVRPYLPVPGSALSVGSCGSIALVLEGLAVSGRLEEAASLQSACEYAVENGPFCLYSQHLLRTSAGIAAAAARNWARAEEHFLRAIKQADSAPYRTAQPIARFRYSEMLQARGMPGDRPRAGQLLTEALGLFESVGMPWYAQRAAERISALGGA